MNPHFRQVHRWLAMVFMVAFGINLAAGNDAALWVRLLALLPLALLMLTGLYLFVQPYAVKWRSARRAA